MKVFEIINNSPIVTVECLLIPEFLEIWKRDKTENKDIAYSELQYIYFKSDYKSLYLAFDSETREEKLLEDFIKKKNWKPDKVILKAIEKYKELQNTPTMDFLESVKNAMVNMTDYFNNVNFKERDSKGVPIYKPEIVTRCAKDAGGIVDSIDKLKAKIKVEIYESDMARGKSQINPFEVQVRDVD